jgi:hypothetical protein
MNPADRTAAAKFKRISQVFVATDQILQICCLLENNINIFCPGEFMLFA